MIFIVFKYFILKKGIIGSSPTSLLGYETKNPMIVIFFINVIGFGISFFLKESFNSKLVEEINEIHRKLFN